MKGDKHWPNTWTEVEGLGNGKFGASISVGHRVFFDKADGNKPKKHKLTDVRPAKDYVLIQGPKCCVEVYPYYAKYFDVQHEEVRLYEERWVCQRLFKEPDTWRDVDAYNPVITIEEYSEPAGDIVKVTVTYDTDYGVLMVEYFQRDGNNLKYNVSFKNTSGLTETFRVVQRWSGIVGSKCNDKETPVDIDEPTLNFHNADKPRKKFNIAENLYSTIYNLDGSEKTEKCLQRPVKVEGHSQGMKADFIYAQWILAQNESLEIDPDTATLDNPTEDGEVYQRDGFYEKFTIYPALPFGRASVMTLTRWYRGYAEWSIGGIPDGSTISKVEFRYEGKTHHVNATNSDIRGTNDQKPTDRTAEETYGDIGNGTVYLGNNATFPEVGSNKDVGGASGPAWDTDPCSDLESALANDWWAFSFKTQESEEEPPASTYYTHEIYSEDETDAPTPKPTLYVEYTTVIGPFPTHFVIR